MSCKSVEEVLEKNKDFLGRLKSTSSVEEFQELVNTFCPTERYHKISLVYPDGEREGVWAGFVSEEDRQVYTSDDALGLYLALLLNYPLGWGGRCIGHPIISTLQGKSRPVAMHTDQPKLDEVCLHLINIATPKENKHEQNHPAA